jgi:PAS domain S-box-containing protein
VYQDDRELILEAYAQLSIDPRSTVHKEVRIMTPHGGQVWVEITFRDMLDDPAVMAIVHNYRDISWRKREQNTEAELTAVLAYASAALFSVDLGGSVQVWRPECERLLGYRKDEIVCRHVQFLIPAHQVETDRASRSAVIESGRSSAPMARELVHQTGKAIQVELVLAPLVTNGAVAGVAYIFETAKA